MKKLITEFHDTGICKVDVAKVCKAWTDKFMILEYGGQFRLAKLGRGENAAKVDISDAQAKEIIEGRKLLRVQDSLFRNAATYKTRETIEKTILSYKKLQPKDPDEVMVLNSIIRSFENALI